MFGTWSPLSWFVRVVTMSRDEDEQGEEVEAEVGVVSA